MPQEVKVVLGLFCLYSNTIGSSGHVISTIHKETRGLAYS